MGKRLSYEESYIIIKEKSLQIGYKLLGTEYLGNDKHILAEDVNGYKVLIIPRLLTGTNNYHPRVFDKSNIYTIDNIKNYIKINKLKVELLSNTYNGNKIKLEFKCLIHETTYKQTIDGFKQGRNGCKECDSYKRGKSNVSIEEVKNIFISNGYTPLFDSFKNQNQKLTGLTKEGYKIFSTLLSIKKHRTQDVFSKYNPYTLDNIKLWIKLNRPTYELISDKYLSSNSLLTIKHLVCDNEFPITWNNFQGNRECPKCSRENRSGENHYYWNPNLTDEDRKDRRDYKGYDQFIQDALRLAGYTCNITGERGGKLEVHHLNGYHWDIKNRTNVENAVVLTEVIHKEFHSIYKCGNNTKEQYEEFKNNKLKQIEENNRINLLKEVV